MYFIKKLKLPRGFLGDNKEISIVSSLDKFAWSKDFSWNKFPMSLDLTTLYTSIVNREKCVNQ